MHPRITALFALTWALATGIPSGTAMAAGNTLMDHPVPYLALHGDDPIHWQEWGPEVMESARRDNRIVLLSIGYFSCHWCHVMQRESFQDPEIAAIANRHFVFVKVDKEMNPALDNAMMSFAQATLGRGGWPLNVFITPDGSPIYALLYLPPDRFREVLERLQSLWSDNEAELRQLVENFPWKPAAESSAPADDQEIGRLLTSARRRILDRGDHFQGGFGVQNKFPSVPQLAFLLGMQESVPDDATREFLTTTLDAMAHLGLRDHLAGGFFRYTVDPGWEIPHFEKMLYDNAVLADLYLEAGRILGREDYLAVARETLDFMRRDMWADGALVSSLSAVDDRDIEGGAYLWQPDELRQLLSEREFAVADAVWGISQVAELEAGNHLRRHRSLAEAARWLGQEAADVERVLLRSRDKLLAARAQRTVPVDHKLVSGWNGLALSAFARAAERFPDHDYGDTAEGLASFLSKRVTVSAEDGTVALARAEVRGMPRGNGSLEDYAYVARGLLDWARLTGDAADYARAADMARLGWERYFDGTGWRHGPALVRTLPEVVPLTEDGPTPSPSATLLSVGRALSQALDEPDWGREISRASRLGFDDVAESPYWYVGQLTLLMREMALRSERQ